jgi:hypothetical protein
VQFFSGLAICAISALLNNTTPLETKRASSSIKICILNQRPLAYDWGNCGPCLSNLAVKHSGYFSSIWVVVPAGEKQRDYQFQLTSLFLTTSLGESIGHEFIGT